MQGSPHPPDIVVHDVRRTIGSISRQSVYDSLAVLAETGLLRRIQPAGSATRYEARGDAITVVTAPAATLPISIAPSATPCLTAANDQGFVIDEAEVIYWGRCPTCSPEHTTSLPKEHHR